MRGGRRRGADQRSVRTRAATDRGVSETVSFILIFSLVIASVGTVYAVGVSELTQTRDAERIENAQRAFDVLSDNVRDVIRGAPSRGTEVKLADATVRAADDARMNVTVTPDSGTVQSWEFSLRPIEYVATSGGQVRLSGGSVLRDSARGEASVIRDPPLVVDDGERLRLTLVKQEHVGSTAVGGSQTIRIRTAASQPRLFYDAEGGHDVMVNVTTPYPDAWARQYEASGFDDCTVVTEPTADTSGTVSCTVSDVDRVSVVWVRITTSFE